MKKINRVVFIALLLCAMNLCAQIKVQNNGNVGINTNAPAYKLDVLGTTRFKSGYTGFICGWSSNNYCPAIYPELDNYLWLGMPDRCLNHIWVWQLDYYSAITKISDSSVKENLQTLSGVLPKLDDLKLYTFNYKDKYYRGFSEEMKTKQKRIEYGVVAQELKEVFPELVYESDEGLLSVDYIGLVPILAQAIKDLQLQIDNLKQTIEATNNDVFKSGFKNDINDATVTSEGCLLHQNSPNPFNTSTNINFYISETVTIATIYVYDMNGKQIKVFPITSRADSSLSINGRELNPGIYFYTLITDGKEVATRKMILTN